MKKPKHFIGIHPESKRFLLYIYFDVDVGQNVVRVKHKKIRLAHTRTLRTQFNCWPHLRELILFCREKIVRRGEFEPIPIPRLANMAPEDIVDAIIAS